MRPARALILDLDGLILDTEPGYRWAWRAAAEALDWPLADEFWPALSGMAAEQVWAAMAAAAGEGFDLPALQRLSGEMWLERVTREGIAVMPGFERLLAEMRRLGLPFCLATNSERAAAEFCLRCAGLKGVFETMICRESARLPKPAPDLVLAAARALKTPEAECWLLEDSWLGVRAGLAAGAQCVWVGAAVETGLAADGVRVAADLGLVAEWLV